MLAKALRRPLNWENPLDMVSSDLGRTLNRLWQEGEPMANVGVYPVDIYEDDNHLYVDAEMPGFSKDQISLTVENSVLHIQAQRSEAGKESSKDNGSESGKEPHTSHLAERRFTRISRAFSLPNTVDENKVDAKLENGVLHLTLHKREEIKPRRIEIK